MSIQRHDPDLCFCYGDDPQDGKMVAIVDGDYVLYTDHSDVVEQMANENTDLGMQVYKLNAALAQVTRERDALKLECDRLAEQFEDGRELAKESYAATAVDHWRSSDEAKGAELSELQRKVRRYESKAGDLAAELEMSKASDAMNAELVARLTTERDEAMEALRQIISASEREVFDQITMSTIAVDGDASTLAEIARAVLAKIEGVK